MNKIHMNHNISQKQTQNLLIKPKMLQSLQLLAAPILELEAYLTQELQKNPMLELVDDEVDYENEEAAPDDNPESELSDEDIEILRQKEEEESHFQEILEEAKELSEVLDSWQEFSNEQYSRLSNAEELDFEKRYESYPDMITSSLDKDKYSDQLDSLNLSEKEFYFAEDLIDSANSHGYLPSEFCIEDLGREYGISPARSNEVHYMILNLSPKGITARTVEECLLVQLDPDDENYENLIKLINEDFYDLIHMRYRSIIAKYGVKESTIVYWKEMISHLDPKSGLRIQPIDNNYITPDAVIKKIGDNLEIIINDYSSSRVRLSKNYLDILKMVKNDREAMDFVRDKINAAKFVINSVYNRGRTLEKVIRAIIRHQPEFFYQEKGILHPLTYSIIADELKVNESTISRVVSSKYVETPFGLMCLKEFFTSRAGKDENYNSVSRHSVETNIKEYIDNEDPHNPISDLDLVEKLQNDGITVSRRLVAKYRQSLGILNSHLRRKS